MPCVAISLRTRSAVLFLGMFGEHSLSLADVRVGVSSTSCWTCDRPALRDTARRILRIE